MRKILLYTLTTLAAAGMASCEDFLTRDTYDQIGSDEFWKSETDLATEPLRAATSMPTAAPRRQRLA